MSQVALTRITSGGIVWDKFDAVFYVAKGGSDANDGKNIETPKLTFGSAITAATAETPAANKLFAVVCLDAGIYTEDLTLVEFVSIHAPNAQLTGSITAANNSSVKFGSQYVAAGGFGVTYAGDESSFIDIDIIECEGATDWATATSTGTLNLKWKSLTLVNGNGVSQTTAYGYIIVDGDAIYISGTGVGVYGAQGDISGRIDLIYDITGTTATAVQTNNANSTVSLSIDHIYDCSISFDIDIGSAEIILNRSGSSTLYDVESGATLWLVVNRTGGAVDKLNDGTVYLNVPIATVVATADVDPIRIQSHYITNNAGGVTYTLPTYGNFGDRFKIIGKTGLWTVAQGINQTIYMGNTNTTTGLAGSLVATDAGDCVELECITEGFSTDWRVVNSMGNITVN